MNVFFKTTAAALVLLVSASSMQSQILYVPNGSGGIGSSSNNNVGIQVSTPSARLDVKTDANIGGLQIQTEEQMAIGGYASSPFALQVKHAATDPTGNPISTISTRILPNGQVFLGTTNGGNYTSLAYLNTPGFGLRIFNDPNDYIHLTYSDANGQSGPRLNWTSSGQTGTDKNLKIAYDHIADTWVRDLSPASR